MLTVGVAYCRAADIRDLLTDIVCIYSEPSPVLAVMPKENIGYGSAFGYYYGYLRLVLPGNQFSHYFIDNNSIVNTGKCSQSAASIRLPCTVMTQPNE